MEQREGKRTRLARVVEGGGGRKGVEWGVRRRKRCNPMENVYVTKQATAEIHDHTTNSRRARLSLGLQNGRNKLEPRTKVPEFSAHRSPFSISILYIIFYFYFLLFHYYYYYFRKLQYRREEKYNCLGRSYMSQVKMETNLFSGRKI